jgi:hypothetical protein
MPVAKKTAAKKRAADLRLKREFGITLAEYDQILKHQKGRCAICEEKPFKRRLAVDHCHKSGLVRGLLCMRCNRALGKFQDSTELVVNAAKYVSKPPASEALGRSHITAIGRVGTKVRQKRLALMKTGTKPKAGAG